jgi:hypothetical protein
VFLLVGHFGFRVLDDPSSPAHSLATQIPESQPVSFRPCHEASENERPGRPQALPGSVFRGRIQAFVCCRLAEKVRVHKLIGSEELPHFLVTIPTSFSDAFSAEADSLTTKISLT